MVDPRQELVVVSRSELEGLIRGAVEEAIGSSGEAPMEYLDIASVAEMLGVTEPTVRSYMKGDGLPYTRLGKSTIRFRRSELERWLLDRSAHQGVHSRRAAAKLKAVRGGMVTEK